jgi:16S rRNA (guanine527-N7)-methyltransferase
MSNLEPNNNLIKELNVPRGTFLALEKLIGEQNVPRGTFLVLEKFVNLLSKWNDKINLVGRKSANLMWQNHVLPSAQLLNHIKLDNPIILDVGSGAGFPGIVLSIIKGWKVILVERSEKKCVFLREAQELTNANVDVENLTIEETNKFSPDIITSRGVTNIRSFLKLVDRFLNDKVKVMLMKGDRCQDEIDESLGKDWHFDYEIKYGQQDKANTIVILSNFRKA